VSDFLGCGSRSPVVELLSALSHAACIRIDCNYQGGLGASRSQAVSLDDVGVPIENRLRS
jgi:hypothetical protein